MKSFKLDNEPKIPAGFTAPDGYFDSFTNRLMQQLPTPEVKVVPLYRRAAVWISGVAAILVIALGVSLYFRMDAKTAQPDDSAIEQYLVYQTNLSSYDLMHNLDHKDFEELEQSIAINDEAIEDYINNEIYLNE